MTGDYYHYCSKCNRIDRSTNNILLYCCDKCGTRLHIRKIFHKDIISNNWGKYFKKMNSSTHINKP